MPIAEPSVIIVVFYCNQGIYIKIKPSNITKPQKKKALFIHIHGGDGPLLLFAFPPKSRRREFPSIFTVSDQFSR